MAKQFSASVVFFVPVYEAMIVDQSSEISPLIVFISDDYKRLNRCKDLRFRLVKKVNYSRLRHRCNYPLMN